MRTDAYESRARQAEQPVAASPPARRMRTPSWLDLRLIAGVLLVLVAVAVGAGVVSAADHRTAMWAVRHDLSAGTILSGDDIVPVRVSLGSAASAYLPLAHAPVGRVVTVPLRAGQLLPRAALEQAADGIAVTVPVRPENMPRLARGDRVTLWLSSRTCKGRVLISGVPVQDVRMPGAGAFSGYSGAGSSVLVLRLAPDRAARVVSVLDLDSVVIRVGVLSAGEPALDDGQSLVACGVDAR